MKTIRDDTDYFITLPEYDLQIKNKYLAGWNEESISLWKDLMTGKGDISEFYKGLLKNIYETVYKFDVLVYWGTNGAVTDFCNTMRIPAISMELGCIRKPFFDSICFDFLGANGLSYINKVSTDNMHTASKSENIYSSFSRNIKCKAHKISSVHAEELYRDQEMNILIPLQLADDANVILHSEYENSLLFLQDVLPKLTAKGFKCFVKPHPGNFIRQYNKNDHKNCKQYCDSFDNAYWLNDIDQDKDYIAMRSRCMELYALTVQSVLRL